MTQPRTIRPETVQDYAAIAAINARAFSQRSAEAVIVDLCRHRAEFDPDLSLVAEVNGEVVGHALFSPHVLRLLDQDVRAVILGPIAIDPRYQKQGIGGDLIAEGHASARAKGFALTMLVGHTSYYPRFGYHTRVFGTSRVTAVPEPGAEAGMQQRALDEGDIPALIALWEREEVAVDFSLRPGSALMDWLSPNPHIAAQVYVRDGAVAGYTRILTTAPAAPRIFFARDADAARGMVALIAAQARAAQSSAAQVELPLHPASASTAAFGAAEINVWDAAMAMSLAPNPFDAYLAQLRAGARNAGRVLWSVEFDVD